MKKIDKLFSKQEHIGLFLLRLFIGTRIIYGVIDNVIIWDKMLEFSKFLEANHFALPVFFAIVSVYVQLLFGLCLLTGYKIRLASFILILNFLVAIAVHLKMGDSIEGMTPALAMLFGCITLLFTGAGKLSFEK